MSSIPLKSSFAVLGMAAMVAAGAARAETGSAQDADPGDAKTAETAAEVTAEKKEEATEAAKEAPETKATQGGGVDKPETDKAETDQAQPAADTTAKAKGEVARAAFAKAIEKREPVNKVERLRKGTEKVYYFTELRDMGGQTVTHRWLYDGEVKAEVQFDVGGPRWRVYSSKDLLPAWTGEWTVEVVNGNDRVVRQDTLVYGTN